MTKYISEDDVLAILDGQCAGVLGYSVIPKDVLESTLNAVKVEIRGVSAERPTQATESPSLSLPSTQPTPSAKSTPSAKHKTPEHKQVEAWALLPTDEFAVKELLEGMTQTGIVKGSQNYLKTRGYLSPKQAACVIRDLKKAGGRAKLVGADLRAYDLIDEMKDRDQSLLV